MKDIYLLGAGASFDTGLPLASNLFDELLVDLKKKNDNWYDIVMFLKKTSNNRFEDAISAVDFLASQNQYDYELRLITYLSGYKKIIKKECLNNVNELINYIKNDWINKKFTITDKNKILYLVPFLKFAFNNNSEIFTLNYDNSLELACKENNIKYTNGMGEERNETGSKFFSSDNFLRESLLKIYKLHGSVGWQIGKFSVDYLYNNIYETENNANELFAKPAIILGSKNKLTSEGMYLELLQIFREKLKIAKNIIIVGYSFLDLHINKFLQEIWLTSPNKNYYIVEPYPPDFNKMPLPHLVAHNYERKGEIDFRNLFCSVENPMNNSIFIIKSSFSKFCEDIDNNKIHAVKIQC